MKNKAIKNQIRAALFAAMISVISLIAIPSPSGVPFTLQTFAVALSGYFLGWKYGAEAVVIYLTAGAVGLPVFSMMTGGFGKILGVTGGFLIGFIPLVLLCGVKTSGIKKALFSLLGIIVCHTVGVLWFSTVSNTSLLTSALTASLPYIPKDVISVLAAYSVSSLIKIRITDNA